jgi:hypothetical protein
MKLSEYLKAKNSRHKILTGLEARLLGISWPPAKGWVKKYADHEFTAEDLDKLKIDLESRIAQPPEPGKRTRKRAHNVRALSAITGAPVKIVYMGSGKPKESTPKPVSQYRGPYIDPNSPEFLQSYQWRTLRFDAIVKYGNACQCCGAVPNPKEGISINVDHIKPRKTHPHLALDVNNLQVLCNVCNHGKSNRHEVDFRPAEDEQDLGDYSDESVGAILKSF